MSFSPVIKFNKIQNCNAFGILCLGNGNGSRINLNTSISMNKRGGIKIDQRARAIIIENYICNNQGQGILITQGSASYIQCNTITGNKKANIAFGPPGQVFKPERFTSEKQFNQQRLRTTEIWFNKINQGKAEGIFGVQANQVAGQEQKFQRQTMSPPNNLANSKKMMMKKTNIINAPFDGEQDQILNIGQTRQRQQHSNFDKDSLKKIVQSERRFIQPVIIKRNSICDNHDGIVLTNYSAKIIDNQILQNTRSGIILSGKSKPVILQNSIRKNTTCGIIFRNGGNNVASLGYIQKNKVQMISLILFQEQIIDNYFQISVTKKEAKLVKDIKAKNMVQGLCEIPSRACSIF